MKPFLLGTLGPIRLTRAAAGEKTNWRAFMLYASLTILAPAGSGAESSARLPDTIKGYGGYYYCVRKIRRIMGYAGSLSVCA
jgi:hypothetical protein